MEETKLDKAVDRLFKFIGKFSDIITNLAKGSGLYFRIIFPVFYILYAIFFIIDIYFHGWKFLILTDGKINIGFILRLFAVFLLYPFQIYIFNRDWFTNFDLKFLKISSRMFAEKVVNNCFKPLISDWRKEHSNAVNQNQKWQALLINLRYTCAFISAMI